MLRGNNTAVKKLNYIKYQSKFGLFYRVNNLSYTNQFNYYTFLFFLYQEQYFTTIYKTPVLLKNINAIEVVPYDILK